MFELISRDFFTLLRHCIIASMHSSYFVATVIPFKADFVALQIDDFVGCVVMIYVHVFVSFDLIDALCLLRFNVRFNEFIWYLNPPIIQMLKMQCCSNRNIPFI